MMLSKSLLLVKTAAITILVFGSILLSQESTYPWLSQPTGRCMDNVKDIEVPEKFQRAKRGANSFDNWLRLLPLREKGSRVYLYNGVEKYNQVAHFRVVDIDIGRKDLQQCADAVMRLQAEYLFSLKKFDEIHFNFTSGDTAWYDQWMQGYRPQVNHNIVSWQKTSSTDKSYKNFRRYLKTVFTYAGSYSLRKEMKKVDNLSDIQIGDVFIQGGFPGHAVIVIDMAGSTENNQIAVLLAQSFMPAQDVHILINPVYGELSPWYIIGQGETLKTPEWNFEWDDLYRFN